MSCKEEWGQMTEKDSILNQTKNKLNVRTNMIKLIESFFLNLPLLYFKLSKMYFSVSSFYLFRPLLRGEELYTQFFFVQTIFADRYINRRELRLVSLESSSSAEYGNKKIFLFSFFTGSYRGLNFCEK